MINYSDLSSLYISNDTVEFKLSDDLQKSFKRFLLELKVQVDRWDLVTDNFVFHNNISDIVKKMLSDVYYDYYNNQYSIWGAVLHFTNDIAKNHVYAVSSIIPKDNDENRHVALGILPSDDLKRYYDLKAFW